MVYTITNLKKYILKLKKRYILYLKEIKYVHTGYYNKKAYTPANKNLEHAR